MQRFICLILPCCLANSINTIGLLISQLLYIHFSTLIFLPSCQAQQISTSHVPPQSLALIFHKCFFYILYNVLAYIQDFSVAEDHVYVYKDRVKQIKPVFKLRFAFASGLVRVIKKTNLKYWPLRVNLK